MFSHLQQFAPFSIITRTLLSTLLERPTDDWELGAWWEGKEARQREKASLRLAFLSWLREFEEDILLSPCSGARVGRREEVERGVAAALAVMIFFFSFFIYFVYRLTSFFLRVLECCNQSGPNDLVFSSSFV